MNWKSNWKWKELLLLLGDIFLITASTLFALFLRFDLHVQEIPQVYFWRYFHYLPIHLACTLLLFYLCRLYHSLWRFASIEEICYLIYANLLSGIMLFVGMNLLNWHLPGAYYMLAPSIQMVTTTAFRFSFRFLRYAHRKIHRTDRKRFMLIGAGAAGKAILNELEKSDSLQMDIRCVIDDNRIKYGKYINGVPVVGNRDAICEMVERFRIQGIILALPSAPAAQRAEILHICQQTGCEVLTLPGIYQLIRGEVTVSQLRPVNVEDLLGRDPIKINLDEIVGYLQDKVILVTGGGGSIGSELCRQIARHKPRQLIILDIYENNAYDIQLELEHDHPQLNLLTLIGSVRNEHRIESIFATYRPDIVFHAAAHKHVPLMENSPNEAVKNNVFGTLNTAKAAGAYGAERFILISTDKAVNPTNVMGATKRICEMIIQGMSHFYPDTTFAAVRFGNVLGSNGSVIPLFRKQIQAGGPVTVTHPDIIRYFMTISEASSLVLQAGAYANGGEIFVLDMGQPVKIADMARKMIRLSGLEPDVDIKIEYTGLRPGEKLYEEMLMAEEGLQDTANHLIHIGKPIQFDEDLFWRQLQELKQITYDDREDVRYCVKQIVPTYRLQKQKEEFVKA